MKLASFNVENLFDRPRIMNLPASEFLNPWKEGESFLTAYAAFNDLISHDKYTDPDKTEIVKLVKQLGLERSDMNKNVVLRQNRQRLLSRRRNGTIDVVAEGRKAWVGWLELRTEPVKQLPITNTGRVIKEVDPDVMTVVEAEDRISLQSFSDQVLPSIDCAPYQHVMLIDGNDARGIDVGIVLKSGYTIESMRSHVDDFDSDGRVFSRDCPEYLIRTQKGNRLWILINHFKSKGYGPQNVSNARRLRQSTRTRQIYDALIADGEKYVAVTGDFNDFPESPALAPLLGPHSTLTDISDIDDFDNGGFVGTFGNCTKDKKFDYILLSSELLKCAQKGGICRLGMWAGTRPKKWETFKEIQEPVDAASDHAAIWAELDI